MVQLRSSTASATAAQCKEIQQKKIDAEDPFAGRESPWLSIYISIAMQFLVGLEISVYFMSMWPYLSTLDPDITMDFLGWVVASCSLGCSVANPLFGLWNHRTLSVANPTCFGMVLTGIGQLFYGLLPVFDSHRKWIMIASRFTTGFGAGCMSVLRAYGAMATHPKDRLRAISFGTAGFVLGLSLGPVIQALFTPIGEKGFFIGPVLFNMYTVPAFAMALLSVVTIFVMKFTFKEEYVGLLNDDEQDDIIVPKYDMPPALVCIYLWIVTNMISNNIEVISTPVSTAMFNWRDSESVLYNAIMQGLGCLISVSIHFCIGYTRFGKIDKRHLIITGCGIFLLFHIANFPWPFYDGPLDAVAPGISTAEVGGCSSKYSWCSETVRVPFFLYIFCYVVCYGTAFPMVTTPAGALFSEILGPRKQGNMQGLYCLGGSVAQFIAPIIATYLFQMSGYKYVMVTQICTLTVGLVLILCYYKRLIPLTLKPKEGECAKTKE